MGSLEWNLASEGKVRSNYESTDGEFIALVASDRVSAFDEILPAGIKGKGIILTKISGFWFGLTEEIVPNAFITIDNQKMSPFFRTPEFEGRTTMMKKLKMLPIEAIVRKHITGSLWKAYHKKGVREFCGLPLPEGLENCGPLEEPLFTPTNKAPQGEHDENIDFEGMVELLEKDGYENARDLAELVKTYSLKLFEFAYDYARMHGIILADTKFEFGVDRFGTLYLADELFTPDSSRFWPESEFKPGREQPSMDKQIIRDYVAAHEGEEIPQDVLNQAIAGYEKVYEMLTEPDDADVVD